MKNTYSYVDALNTALTILTELADGHEVNFNGDLHPCVNKLTALRDQTMKRNASKSDKPTKTQRENEGVKDAIREFLRTNPDTRCGDIATAVGISGQKASALLIQLVKAGEVIKAEGPKRVTLFRLAA